ncbi:hypothetical protein Glove_302g54 [Diversispora epigaea]|uniref:Uncharacterized protein n=1 Tax=Diversispora epigaea TaxID=1348612 RepID=A0A397I1N2_9GLOM|nr:hypothetical protein Glove_302g54 [Diversispora epigaea]
MYSQIYFCIRFTTGNVFCFIIIKPKGRPKGSCLMPRAFHYVYYDLLQSLLIYCLDLIRNLVTSKEPMPWIYDARIQTSHSYAL